MAVPDFQSLMLPLLKFSADGEKHTIQEAREGLAKIMGLSQEDIEERLPSGWKTTFANRVAWAKVYLTQAGVLESPKRWIRTFSLKMDRDTYNKCRQGRS